MRHRASFRFRLLLAGSDALTDEHIDALFEAGCDDGSFGESQGVQSADFTREAASFAEAVGSAIHDVERAVRGLYVSRVEQDDFVSAADIARKTGRSRESVRLLVEGRRGPGGFPTPAIHDGSFREWRWPEVARWFESALGERIEGAEHAEFIAALNAALEARHLADLVERPEERRVVARIVREDVTLYETKRRKR